VDDIRPEAPDGGNEEEDDWPWAWSKEGEAFRGRSWNIVISM
jgi:hypothetical protein